jgi:hypothetical protein
MAIASTTAHDTDATLAAGVTEIADTLREQFVSGLQQGQKLSVDVAKGWAKAVSVLPVPDLPTIPGLPAAPDVAAVTKYTFDVAADLLKAQRDFVLKLTDVVVPAKTA